jgi:RNA polymerase sigma-70 factor (ECF subfamily)
MVEVSSAVLSVPWVGPVSRGTTHAVETRPEGAAEVIPSFETLYREQYARLFSVVRSVMGDSDETEDVLQLVFIEIHRCLPRFEGRSRLSTWLYRIAVNVALQHVRKRRRKRWLVLGPTGEEEARVPSPRNEIGRVEDREMLSQIGSSLRTLSEKKRVVWQLHELQGLEPQEIAEVLDIPMNTVRSRLLSARKDLMEDLERRGLLENGRGR